MTFDGDERTATVLRVLDRHGHDTGAIDLAEPPPFTTVVLRIEGYEDERVSVPLWLEERAVAFLQRQAA